jgi:hypothetical protein
MQENRKTFDVEERFEEIRMALKYPSMTAFAKAAGEFMYPDKRPLDLGTLSAYKKGAKDISKYFDQFLRNKGINPNYLKVSEEDIYLPATRPDADVTEASEDYGGLRTLGKALTRDELIAERNKIVHGDKSVTEEDIELAKRYKRFMQILQTESMPNIIFNHEERITTLEKHLNLK